METLFSSLEGPNPNSVGGAKNTVTVSTEDSLGPSRYLNVTGGKVPVLELYRVWCTSSLPLLACLLWNVVKVPITVPSIGRIDLFENYL